MKKDVDLVVVDNLTKYWDLEQLNDTDAESTILQMKKIFARQGVPEAVISDNGPQYASKEFKEFSESWNFHHHTSSPHHPKGNGTAEAAVKQAKRILGSIFVSGQPSSISICRTRLPFLLDKQTTFDNRAR